MNVKGLLDERNAALIQTALMLLLHHAGAHGDHRDVPQDRIRVDPPRDFQTVQERDIQIKQDQSWVVLLHQLQPGHPIPGREHLVALGGL